MSYVNKIEGNQHRILYYKPHSAIARANALLREACDIDNSAIGVWELLPMPNETMVTSNNLTGVLSYVLDYVSRKGGQSCTFLGSDMPLFRHNEVIIGQEIASCGSISWQTHKRQCYICPAEDGGYVQLTLPLPLEPMTCSVSDIGTECFHNHAIFDSVKWSSSTTLSSQVSALESFGLEVLVGREVYNDIDEPEDLLELVESVGNGQDKDDRRILMDENLIILENTLQIYSPPMYTLESLNKIRMEKVRRFLGR